MTRSLRRIFRIDTLLRQPDTQQQRPQVTRDEIAALFGPELGYGPRDYRRAA